MVINIYAYINNNLKQHFMLWILLEAQLQEKFYLNELIGIKYYWGRRTIVIITLILKMVKLRPQKLTVFDKGPISSLKVEADQLEWNWMAYFNCCHGY